MLSFKKSTAIALAVTLLGGVATQAVPLMDMSLQVHAADSIDDAFIVTDYDTGEVISSDRLINIFNSPAEGEGDKYIGELETVEEKDKVTITTMYRAKHLVIPEDFIGITDNTKYHDYIRCIQGNGEVHLYLITNTVTCTTTKGKDGNLIHKYKVKQTPKGAYNLQFTKEDGQTYRTFHVVVNQATKSIKTTINYMGYDKEYEITPESGMIMVENHSFQLKAKIDSSSTDSLKYRIVKKPNESSGVSKLATIDKDGVITTLGNGTAYLEITHTNDANYTYPVIETIDKKTGDQTLYYKTFLPQYYPLYIVKENPAKTISIDEKFETLRKDEKRQLSVTVTPTYTEDEYPTSATDILRWESSNTKVAKVTDDGLLTVVGAGQTVITVRGENDLVKDSFVLNGIIPVSSLVFDQTGVQTYVGMTEDISVQLKPNYADEQVYWKSEDESIVTVEGGTSELVKKNYKYNAKIKAIGVGTTTVTAYTKSGIKATMTVTVLELPKIDSIKLTYNDKEIKSNTCTIFTGQSLYFNMVSMAGDTEVPFDQIKVTISKGGSDIAKATINKQGLVTLKGISRGSLKLYFKSSINPAFRRVVNVNIKRPADSVEYTVDGVAKSSKTMLIGDTAKIKAELKTKNADGIHDDNIRSYKSSDTAVATVSKNGKVTAKSEGEAKITIKTDSSQTFKLVTVNVIKVAKIEIKKVKDGVYDSDEKVGNTLDLDINVYDSNNKKYTDLKPTWTLDDTGVLTVTSDNELKVNKLGTTTVKCKIGGVTVSFKVKLTHEIKDAKYTENNDVELGASVKPDIVLKDGEVILKEGTDYTVDAVKDPKLGANTAIIHGKGNYYGETKIRFYVVAHSMTKATVTGLKSKVYTGDDLTQNPVVKYNGVTLKAGVDYTMSYHNNTAVGKASIKFLGKGNYKDTLEKTFDITPANISRTSITVSEATYSTKKGEGKPEVTVKFGSSKLREDRDYTVAYSNNKKLGNATATIKGIGNFTGSVSKTFKVVSKYPLKITVSNPNVSISVNGRSTIRYTIADASFVSDKTVKFSSSSSKIAKVDSNGVITGVSKGTATITVDAHGAKATVRVTVK